MIERIRRWWRREAQADLLEELLASELSAESEVGLGDSGPAALVNRIRAAADAPPSPRFAELRHRVLAELPSRRPRRAYVALALAAVLTLVVAGTLAASSSEIARPMREAVDSLLRGIWDPAPDALERLAPASPDPSSAPAPATSQPTTGPLPAVTTPAPALVMPSVPVSSPLVYETPAPVPPDQPPAPAETAQPGPPDPPDPPTTPPIPSPGGGGDTPPAP